MVVHYLLNGMSIILIALSWVAYTRYWRRVGERVPVEFPIYDGSGSVPRRTLLYLQIFFSVPGVLRIPWLISLASSQSTGAEAAFVWMDESYNLVVALLLASFHWYEARYILTGERSRLLVWAFIAAMVLGCASILVFTISRLLH